MTELSFLIDLLLNGRLQKSVQEKVKQRISEVEQNMSLPQALKQFNRNASSPTPAEVSVVAHTMETSKALAQRNEAIQAAVNQKPIEVSTGNGTKGPRKF